tara:strand:- start:950 stop:1429 length:480 start_codon:yes stop_codon:yes gene_type:complete
MNFVRIDGYPDYVIHPVGTILKIWKHKTKERKPIKQKNGYIRIELTNNGKGKKFLVHRLLALHFIPNDDPENKIEIDHNDSVRDNNRLQNLEWVTHAENIRRRDLNHPPAEITQCGIRKTKYGWIWRYHIKGKRKSKSMKNLNDLEKYKEETLKKYLIS